MIKNTIAAITIVMLSTVVNATERKQYIVNNYEYNYNNDVAVSIGGLELPTPDKNNISWSAGFGGVQSTIFSGGLAYGLSDKMFAYGKMSFDNGSKDGYYFGLSGKF